MENLLNRIKRIIPKRLFKALQPPYHFIMSWLSALVFCCPSQKIIVIGITGTTGKTTSVFLIAQILRSAGCKVGFTSTAMFSDGNKDWLNDKKMTMVGRFFTQKILRKMIKNNCQYAIIETTSEGIKQFRHKFINYDILVFTGIYPEHIESHGSFEKYRDAKGKLFRHLKRCRTKYADDKRFVKVLHSGLSKINHNRIKKTIIANGEDKQAGYFLNFWAEEKLIFGLAENSPMNMNDKYIQVLGDKLKISAQGLEFYYQKNKLKTALLGEFNIYNILASMAVAISQNIDIEDIKKGLETINNLPGRLESIKEGQNFSVIVDYAFEPRAVEKLYNTVKLFEHNKIIHVLGSTGGGRDRSRRSALGELAGGKADVVIVTNEDPYDDDPQTIIDEVADGAIKSGKVLNENLFKILDRRTAIRSALNRAEEGDIVLITGKGCEQAICVANGEKIAWDDREVAREELIILNL